MRIKDLLTYYLGLVFIFASLHRVLYKNQRKDESLNVMKLPKYSDILIIIFEFTVGVLLLSNFKYKMEILKLLLLFLIVGSVLIIIYNKDKLMDTYTDIWTFQPTSMSFVLHLAYIVIIFSIIYCTDK
jgi:uncharacterized membrane protein YphA (DoxX/SURF4 family)